MPRFYFDTSDGDQAHEDDEGLELAGREAARTAALEALPDMARDKIPDGDARTFVVIARDEHGRQMYAAKLVLSGGWVS